MRPKITAYTTIFSEFGGGGGGKKRELRFQNLFYGLPSVDKNAVTIKCCVHHLRRALLWKIFGHISQAWLSSAVCVLAMWASSLSSGLSTPQTWHSTEEQKEYQILAYKYVGWFLTRRFIIHSFNDTCILANSFESILNITVEAA